ncbi:ABC transporter permease [Actinoplanes sp. CA-142083]|uniref:ABC transporter permease n=1 Tax=Actinoplanes sp. CA-142083 TaxID=3239903 RepID=UPI003D8DF61B
MLTRPPAVRAPKRPRRRRTRLWSLLTLPGTIWMSVFFLSALLLTIALSFGVTDDLGNPHFASTLANWAQLAEPAYAKVIVRSFLYAGLASVICLLIAYPVSYVIALHGGRFKHALIAAIVVPFFANYLVRMYGWSTVLADDGPVLRAARAMGAPASIQILNTGFGVVAGLVYGFVVFMILPLYAAMERMDVSLIEAGRDLYGGPLRTFLFVTVPATRQGALAGLVLVFLPATGDFVSAQLLGGPNQIMIGNLIQQKFFDGQNWPLGCALTVLLMALLIVGLSGYIRQSRRDET